jgi:hypothetical protein
MRDEYGFPLLSPELCKGLDDLHHEMRNTQETRELMKLLQAHGFASLTPVRDIVSFLLQDFLATTLISLVSGYISEFNHEISDPLWRISFESLFKRLGSLYIKPNFTPEEHYHNAIVPNREWDARILFHMELKQTCTTLLCDTHQCGSIGAAFQEYTKSKTITNINIINNYVYLLREYVQFYGERGLRGFLLTCACFVENDFLCEAIHQALEVLDLVPKCEKGDMFCTCKSNRDFNPNDFYTILPPMKAFKRVRDNLGENWCDMKKLQEEVYNKYKEYESIRAQALGVPEGRVEACGSQVLAESSTHDILHLYGRAYQLRSGSKRKQIDE